MKLRNQCMGLTGFFDPIEEKIYRNITQSHISELKFACKNTIYVITFIIQIWICIQTNWQDLLNFFFRKLISQSFGNDLGKGNNDFIQFSFLQIILL